jgi:hypothetical protein
MPVPEETGDEFSDIPQDMPPPPPVENAPAAPPQTIEVHCDCGGKEEAEPSPEMPPDEAVPEAPPIEDGEITDDLPFNDMEVPSDVASESKGGDPASQEIMGQLEEIKNKLVGLKDGQSGTYQGDAEVTEYLDMTESLISKMTESPDEFVKDQAREFIKFFEDTKPKEAENPEASDDVTHPAEKEPTPEELKG